MFAQFTRRLTLLVFTAHAVLGCCWHHSHAFGNDCSGQDAGYVVVEGCESSHDHPESTGTACSDHDAAISVEGDGAPADHLLAGCESAMGCDSPCDHSHECSETVCSFVQIGPQPFDANPAAEFAVVDVSAFVLKPVFAIVCDVGRVSRARYAGSPQRCARLQSWQI